MKFEAEQKKLEETEDSGNMTRNKRSALVCTMEWFGKKALTPLFFNNSVYINQDYGKNLLQLQLISYANISSQWFLLGTLAGKKKIQKCWSFYERFDKVWLLIHILYLIMQDL